MTLVVDASVAVKWFFDETGHAAARALLDGNETLIAPSIVLAEIANAAWKRCRRREVTRANAEEVARLMAGAFSRIVPIEQIAIPAARLSFDLNHPIYDCFYLALAARDRTPLVTADRRILTMGKGRSIETILLGN